MMDSQTETKLLTVYESLEARYGDLQWWPTDTPFEIMVGAILTQNTAWGNVEKAIARFGDELSPERIVALEDEALQEIIRPAGFYKQKARYLKAMSTWFLDYGAEVRRVQEVPLATIRPELLAVPGIGNETCDSILLYAFGFPTFVVDAYTMRHFQRLPLDAGKNYREVQACCEAALPRDVGVYRNFHALIVQNGKDYCRKKRQCSGCPLEGMCQKLGSE